MRVQSGHALGARLSNTRSTCPEVGDKLGKLRIIPHSAPMLEGLVRESSGASGWDCGLSGCSGGNGLTSLQRVRALGDVARRWILRHESRPYGAQQARKLRNGGNHDAANPSASTMCWLSSSVRNLGRKCWVRRV